MVARERAITCPYSYLIYADEFRIESWRQLILMATMMTTIRRAKSQRMSNRILTLLKDPNRI